MAEPQHSLPPRTISVRVKNADQWLQLRQQFIGGSEAAVLLGVEKYQSFYELWYRKAGRLEEPELDSRRVILGTHLEEGVIAAAREIHGSNIRIVRRYVHRTDLRMGASMDAEELVDGRWCPAEVKVVALNVWRSDWAEDDDGEVHVPLHIAIQCQHYMGVTGAPCAVLYVLVAGEKVERIVVPRNDKIIELIEGRVREFWRQLEANEEPPPNYTVDLDAMKRVMTNVAPETKDPVDMANDANVSVLMLEYRQWHRAYKQAEERLDEIKARLLAAIGEHQKVKTSEGTISAKLVPARPEETKTITYKAAPPRRDFRVYLTKESKDE